MGEGCVSLDRFFKDRKAGVLLHPTSLPGPYGIGAIGPQAREFARRLAGCGQRVWQMLPLTPVGYGASPYQSISSFAGNPLLISLEDLREEGLLRNDDVADYPEVADDTVEYGVVGEAKRSVLQRVCAEFDRRASDRIQSECRDFCERSAYWLDDYALFMAAKRLYDGASWQRWPKPLRLRESSSLKALAREQDEAIRQTRVLQFVFERQWRALRETCREAGVALIGDVPIFTALDSADVWANRSLFKLNRNGNPTAVAGVPPDYFSATGQLWGNPVYDWSRHREEEFAWWMSRIGRTFDWVDILRIDHFRGFAAYWEVPARNKTARKGHWEPSPGTAFFKRLRRTFGALPIIAEDLGVITDDVIELREAFDLPGMRVLQFAFCDGDDNAMDPMDYPENAFVYTGTHDNDTIVGWYNEKPGDGLRSARQIAYENRRMDECTKGWGREVHWRMIRLAFETPCHTAVIPLQDIWGLDSSARMNRPGTAEGNWRWRFRWDQWDEQAADTLRNLTCATGRSAS